MSFSATISYKIYIGDRVMKGASTWTTTAKKDRQPQFPGSVIQCDLDNVDIIESTDGSTVTVYWNEAVFGPGGDTSCLTRETLDLALIQTFEEGLVLLAQSQPSMDDRIGVWIVNAERKPLFTGKGDLVDLPEPKGLQQLIATIDATFQWPNASPKGCGTTTGTIRKDPGPVQGAPTQPKPPSGGPKS